MPELPQFNQEKMPEIQELKNRIEKLESELKKETPLFPEQKEKAIRQEIKSYVQELSQTPSFAAPQSTRDEVGEISKFEPDQQVGALLSLALGKGLKEAISIANSLSNPAVLDELHDALVDHYYQTMIEREILKP